MDIEGRCISALDVDTGTNHRWNTVERPASLALHRQGGLLVAMGSRLFRLQPDASGTMAGARVAVAAHSRSDMRFNDGRCDREGRFWVSSMVRDMSLALPEGRLYCYDKNGVLHQRLSGLVTGNGLAFSPDGKRLYLSDSHPSVRRIWVFDLDAQGQLSERREFADLSDTVGRPDGAAVDAEGGYWSCANDGGAVLRSTPEGRLERQLKLPFAKPSMCAFGGPRMETLYVTSIRPAVPIEGYDHSLAGAVIAIDPNACGIPELHLAQEASHI